MGADLAELVNADFVSVDDGSLGCTRNHARVWHALDLSQPWAVVLEDDAVPVEDFRDQLCRALEVVPAPVASLYLGSGYIGDKLTEALLHRADITDSHWIVAHGQVHHAVALAVRSDIVPSMVEFFGARTQPVDRLLSTWARVNAHRVAYSVPSLVDHADVSSLVTKYRRKPRKALRVGGRDTWCSKVIPMS